MNLWSRIVAAGAVLRGSGVPASWFNRAIEMGGGTETDLSQPYRQSVWVMRAIKKVAQPISSVTLEHYDEADNQVDDPLLDVFWNEPCADLGWPDLVEATVGWLKLAGESFWLLDDSWLVPFPSNRSAAPAPVVVARPDRMKHVVRDGRLAGWEFTDAAHQRHTLLPEQVIQLKFWNPYDPIRGLGEYEAAKIAAASDYSSANFAKAIADSNGDQGVYIVAKSGIPTDAQREQIITQLREKRAMQQRGYFKPMFLTGDISVEDPRVRSVDAAFNETRRMNRHEIFIAFGVPASMADKMESYSIGSASDWFVLINETCMPTGHKLLRGVSEVSTRLTGRTLYGWLNWDEHPVMQTVRGERMQSVDTLWNKGMPLNLVSDYLDLGLPRFEGDEVGYLPFSVAPAGEMGMQSAPAIEDEFSETDENEDEEENEDEGPLQEAIRALRSRLQTPDPRPETLHTCAPPTNPQDLKVWRAQMRQRREALRNYESKLNKLLMQARRETLQKLESSQRSIVPRAAAGDFLFDLGKWKQGLLAEMRKAAGFAFDLAGTQFFAEIEKDDPWQMPPTAAHQFFDARENKISGAADDIFQSLMRNLQEGIDKGESIKDLSDRVRTTFNEVSAGRAKRIAMTETGAAYATARQEAMTQAQVAYKKWLTSGGLNVRPAHRDANHQTIPVDQKFKVVDPETGKVDYVSQPGDPNGAPWNVINCHCVAVATKGPPTEAEPMEGEPTYE